MRLAEEMLSDMKRVGIVGLGMMGGSLGAALNAAGYGVTGYDLSDEVMAVALEKGYICAPLGDIENIDVLIVALTEEKTLEALKIYAPRLRAGAAMMDICGNKRRVAARMEELKAEYPALHFVGTHPMAGRETDGKRYGIYKASAKLFCGAYAVAVPICGDETGLDAAREIYLAAGAKGVKIATAEEHDRMISYTSQLAHILSSSYAKSDKARMHRGFSAGSFLDLTRVARLDADMWAELFLNNRDALLEDAETLIAELERYVDALKRADGDGLRALLEEGNAFKDAADRDAFCDKEEK